MVIGVAFGFLQIEVGWKVWRLKGVPEAGSVREETVGVEVVAASG